MSVQSKNMRGREVLDDDDEGDDPYLAGLLASAKPATPVAFKIDPMTQALIGIVLAVFGLLQWIPAARFTADGWVAWINMFTRWLTLGDVIPRLAGVALVGVALAIGLAYSRVEISALPIKRLNKRWSIAPLAVCVAWLFMAGTDVGTTFTGLMAPPPNSFLAWQQLAQNPPLAAALAFYLTFLPDWCIIGGIRLMMTAWRR